MQVFRAASRPAITVCSQVLLHTLFKNPSTQCHTELNWGGVKRCDLSGNSWCCAGRDTIVDCCNTTSTSSLEPYPFSVTDVLMPSEITTSPASSTEAVTFSSIVSVSLGSAMPTGKSYTSTSSGPHSWSTTQTDQNTARTSGIGSANGSPNNSNGLSKSDWIAIGIGLPVGLATIVSTFLLIASSRKRNRRRSRNNRSLGLRSIAHR